MRYIFLVCLGLVLASSSSLAQKVKYKDLFVLLRVENYDDADKFLRIYLKQEPEDPHANYSMGRMLQTYLDQGDLLNGSARIKEMADSSKYYYGRAMELTTEKYVKKHDDDYYLDFRRRDMRTGKFQVKYSDVQYDMEERIEAVDKFIEDLDRMLGHFSKAQEFYNECQTIFKDFTGQSRTKTHLLFTTTIEDTDQMRRMAQLYDSSLYHLNTYMSIMDNMGKSAVKQELKEVEISTYPGDGLREVDFYKESVDLMNYKTWANTTIDVVLKQIFPLKKRLITFDKRVTDLHDEVVSDTLDKRDEVFRLATENVGRDLRDYDANSLPAAIFNYRIAEINFHSAVNYWLKEIADTFDIEVKRNMLYDFTSQINGVSKLVYKMHEVNTSSQIDLYNEYITARYESPEGLNRFILEHEEEVSNDSLQLIQWLAELKRLDKIAIWQEDSIALTAGVTMGPADHSFTTLFTDSLATRTYGFYTWERAGDSLLLTFGVAPSSRRVDSLFRVPIKPSMYDLSLPLPEYLVDTVGLGQRVWLLQENEMRQDSTFAAQVFKTDYTLGPTWIREIVVADHITRIALNTESGNLVVLGEEQVELAVLDKYGELVITEIEEEVPADEEEKGDEEKGEEQENKGNSEKEGGGGS